MKYALTGLLLALYSLAVLAGVTQPPPPRDLPEPGTLVLLGAAVGALLIARRGKK